MSKGHERIGGRAGKACDQPRQVVHQSDLLGPTRTKNSGGGYATGHFAPAD